jgi:hypothetical protein
MISMLRSIKYCSLVTSMADVQVMCIVTLTQTDDQQPAAMTEAVAQARACSRSVMWLVQMQGEIADVISSVLAQAVNPNSTELREAMRATAEEAGALSSEEVAVWALSKHDVQQRLANRQAELQGLEQQAKHALASLPEPAKQRHRAMVKELGEIKQRRQARLCAVVHGRCASTHVCQHALLGTHRPSCAAFLLRSPPCRKPHLHLVSSGHRASLSSYTCSAPRLHSVQSTTTSISAGTGDHADPRAACAA